MKASFTLLLVLFVLCRYGLSQNIGINSTGALPDAKAMLDISSTTSGLLIPRMTTQQRDAIASPPIGLYIYNLTTKTFDVYNGTAWESLSSRNNTVILVKSLADLPAPNSGAITLVSNRTYLFSGLVDIGSNYINLNGAALMGQSPLSDAVMSTASGAILRSTDKIVHVQQISIVPNSAGTTAFNFSDATGNHTCAILTGTSVRGLTGVSQGGVGQISGFRDAIILNNLWDVPDGVKLGGSMDGLIFAYNIVHGLASGTAVEFLTGLIANDVGISNNQFDYAGSTVVKMNSGVNIDFGRMINNNFRGASSTVLTGFDSYTPGWEMSLNTGGVPNSRSYAYSYMDGNLTPTKFLAGLGTFTKIAGTTVPVTAQKFSHSANRFTYIGKRNITARVFATIGCKAPSGTAADYTIAIALNDTVIPQPTSSLGPLSNGQGFQIVLETEVSMATNQYIEVFVRANTNSADLVVTDFQFRVAE